MGIKGATVVTDASQLLTYRDEILRLFEQCFGAALDRNEWEWLFLSNPTGSPIVAVLEGEDELLGHFALVPFQFTNGQRTTTAWRSGTTMIHPRATLPGLMAVLGRAAHSEAIARGGEIIFGFPNDNSTKGFQRFLRWTVMEEEYLVNVRGQTILGNPAKFLTDCTAGAWRLDHGDVRQMEWRLGRPTVTYRATPGLITSLYRGVPQILHLEPAGLEGIEPDREYRVYLNGSSSDGATRFRYRYGYTFPNSKDMTMGRPSLLSSDVF